MCRLPAILRCDISGSVRENVTLSGGSFWRNVDVLRVNSRICERRAELSLNLVTLAG